MVVIILNTSLYTRLRNIKGISEVVQVTQLPVPLLIRFYVSVAYWVSFSLSS